MERFWGIGLSCFFVAFTAWAATERITDYQYDGAGNIVRILNNEQSNPPDVVSIDPGFVNLGRTVTMTATGTDLFAAQVTTSTPGLSITNVNADKFQVKFNLSATLSAPLGPAAINFTTGLGTDSETIIVAEALPGLTTNPSPVAIAANNQPTTIQLIFTEARPSEETYTVSTTDPAIAASVQAAVTVAAGATTAQLDLTGLVLGSTTLNVVLASKFYFFSFPVFVSESFSGGSEIFSRDVGVFFHSHEGSLENSLISQSVGVFVEAGDGGVGNPLLSQNIGVLVESSEGSIGNPLISNGVGIFRESGQSGVGNPLLAPDVGIFFESIDGGLGNPLLSAQIGVFSGPVVTGYEPTEVQSGANLDIQMSGFELGEVMDISIEPAGEIVIQSFVVAPDGASLVLTITVDPVVPSGNYQIIITTANGEVTLAQGNRVVLTVP